MKLPRRFAQALLLVFLLCLAAAAQNATQDSFKPDLPTKPHVGKTICMKFDDFEWKKDDPDLGEASPASVLLRHDDESGASEWMVRLPPGFRLPKHWHSANQTHTVISGTYVMAEDGKEPIELSAGSFNYAPARLVHEGWVKGNEPVVLFVTFDAKRDNRIVGKEAVPDQAPEEEFLCVTPSQVKWQKFDENGPAEFAILHEHPRTKAAQLLIRSPANYYVPKHWHSADETHAVLEGSFIFNCGGEKVELDTGSFNHIPARLIHNARIGSAATTLFVTVHGAWDIRWVEPPLSAKPSDPNDMFAEQPSQVTEKNK